MSLPSIDWVKSIGLAGGKKELAQQLLVLFIDHLPRSQQGIRQAVHAKNIQQLSEQVHKLYGACCYCSVPVLLEILSRFGDAIRLQKTNLFLELLHELDREVLAVQQAYAALNIGEKA